MSDALGLSLGMANLVAARVGSAPVTRRSVLTLFADRPPEVGVPDENPNLTEPGLVLHGFIAGVGDPSPFVAPDGSAHRSDVLTAEALDAMARTVGHHGASIAVAVPAYWAESQVAALREALRPKPSLATGAMPAALVSDARAALAALYAKPGFPTDGVVALCDFGASGTSVTLSDAASNFRRIGHTVRYPDYSGDQVDQAILRRLQFAFVGGNSDIAGTTPVGSLSRRLDECRRAKEQLSAATVTVVPAEMPGVGEDVRLSRAELEDLISEPLDRFISTVEEVLRHNGVPASRLAAVATVGGGACIPLVTQRLEQRLHAPVVTTPHPVLSAAIGAAVIAEQQSASTGIAAPVSPPGDTVAPATEIDHAAWAADVGAVAAGESVEDGAQSGTYRALAWSQDASSGPEELPYADEYDADAAAPPETVEPARRSRRGRPGLVFGLAAMAALIAVLGSGVVVFKLSNTNAPTRPPSSIPRPSRLPSVGRLPPAPPPSQPPPATDTETETTEGSAQAPAPPTSAPPTTTSTTTLPSTTTTQPSTAPPTTTTTQPTTTFSYPPLTTSPSVPSPTTTVLVPPRLVPVKPPYGR